MRALWIALLIALLPLRGWVGDAMALDMLPAAGGQQALASAHGEPCPHGSQAVDTGPAHEAPSHHASAGLHGDADPAGNTDGPAAHQHLACDLCNGPALDVASPTAPGEQIAPGPRVQRAERFASLAPRHLHKPPIA